MKSAIMTLNGRRGHTSTPKPSAPDALYHSYCLLRFGNELALLNNPVLRRRKRGKHRFGIQRDRERRTDVVGPHARSEHAQHAIVYVALRDSPLPSRRPSSEITVDTSVRSDVIRAQCCKQTDTKAFCFLVRDVRTLRLDG